MPLRTLDLIQMWCRTSKTSSDTVVFSTEDYILRLSSEVRWVYCRFEINSVSSQRIIAKIILASFPQLFTLLWGNILIFKNLLLLFFCFVWFGWLFFFQCAIGLDSPQSSITSSKDMKKNEKLIKESMRSHFQSLATNESFVDYVNAIYMSMILSSFYHVTSCIKTSCLGVGWDRGKDE